MARVRAFTSMASRAAQRRNAFPTIASMAIAAAMRAPGPVWRVPLRNAVVASMANADRLPMAPIPTMNVL